MITAGVSTACLYPELLEDALLKLAKAGIKNIELFLNSHCELESDFLHKLKQITDTYNISVASFHPYTCAIEPMMFFTQYERRFFDIIDYYKRYFETMNYFDAKVFVFHGNKPQNPFDEEKYFERYQKLFQTGKEFGITVAQENVSRCVSGDLGFCKRMTDALGQDAKFVLDTKQAVRKGYDPYEFLDTLGKHIIHIHISDYGDKGDCLLVGEGNINFQRFLNKLINCSFSGSIILELYHNGYNSLEDLSSNYNYMQTIIKHTCYFIQN